MSLTYLISNNIRLLSLLAVLVGFLSDPAHAQKLHRYEFEDPHMGTLFRIVLYAPDISTANAASDSAFRHIELLDDIMSDYRDNSELNRLSAKSGTDKFIKISPPLFKVISEAQLLAEETDGAFDITVGPYVQLWRSVKRTEHPELPSGKLLTDLRKFIGYQYLKLDRPRLSVALISLNMKLDLGGIAKGFATDEALRVLNAFGIHSALIDAGGDIMMGDPPPGREGWKISIPIHNGQDEREYMTLILANRAVATSGDFFQFTEIGGIRYSHIVDPHTGLGLTNQSTVTVIAPDGITADSYASAVSVLGPSKGIPFIESKPSVETFIEFSKDGKIQSCQSTGFKRLHQFNQSDM